MKMLFVLGIIVLYVLQNRCTAEEQADALRFTAVETVAAILIKERPKKHIFVVIAASDEIAFLKRSQVIAKTGGSIVTAREFKAKFGDEYIRNGACEIEIRFKGISGRNCIIGGGSPLEGVSGQIDKFYLRRKGGQWFVLDRVSWLIGCREFETKLGAGVISCSARSQRSLVGVI